MPPKRQAQVSAVELQQEHRHDEEGNNKCARSANGNDQQQQEQPGLNVNCKQSINLPPPPLQDDNPIITQFKPRGGQWGLNDDNIKRIDSKTRETILHNYCKYINTTPLEVYRFLIETMSCDVNAQDNFDETPIYHALCFWDPNYRGDIAVLQYLLTQMNINVNTNNNHGNTLLHRACDNINNLPIEVFKYLIETMGGDVNAQDKYNETPIHVALLCFNSNTGADITVLTYLLTQKGLNANMKDPEGNALLYIACEKINRLPLDVFKFLIETMGLDLNARSGRPTTPLHYVLAFFNPNKGGDIDVLTYLLNQKNIDANIKNQYGSTLLHHACNNINKLPLDVFKVLIETHGGDVNTLNNPNDTPLHLAIRHFDPDYGGDINVLTYVINQNNVNVNIKNRNGFNLLHLTCTNNLPSSSRSVELNAECDSILCHIVEVIVEKCIQQVLNETTS